MLPWLDKKKISQVILKRQDESGSIQPAESVPSDLEMAMEDLLKALESKDKVQMADAFRAAILSVDNEDVGEE